MADYEIIKAPKPFRQRLGVGKPPSIFLAGSIDMGAAVDWQTQVSEALKGYDITILNPRRDDWDSSWKEDISNPQFNQQVNWELNALGAVDLIIFYFDPEGKAPITLLELGLHADQNVIVCCPEGYWKRGNVQIVCERKGIPWAEDIDELVSMTIEQLGLR